MSNIASAHLPSSVPYSSFNSYACPPFLGYSGSGGEHLLEGFVRQGMFNLLPSNRPTVSAYCLEDGRCFPDAICGILFSAHHAHQTHLNDGTCGDYGSEIGGSVTSVLQNQLYILGAG